MSESGIRQLIQKFHEQESFALGEFVLKSGAVSPIYIDLRLSSIPIIEKVAEAIAACIRNQELHVDYVVGVPFGALVLAGFVAKYLEKPMLLKRKEAKNYGKKLLIEGHYEKGKKALVVEDVVTSGASIIETIETLRAEKLICNDVVCILDRQQGATENLKKCAISLKSLITMETVLDFLVDQQKITLDRKVEIQNQLKNPQYRHANETNDDNGQQSSTKESDHAINGSNGEHAINGRDDKHNSESGEKNRDENVQSAEESFTEPWCLESRKSLFKDSAINTRLIEIIMKKKTNLCLALDFNNKDDILEAVEKTKEYICSLKLHSDIIDDFDRDFIDKIRRIANNYEFIIIEDRKLADTGETMQQQLTHGPLPIAEWADLVTVHALPGAMSLKTLTPVLNDSNYKLKGIILIAQMSTSGSLTDESYIEKSVHVAKDNSSIVNGFVCQKRCHTEPNFFYWTPGVNSSGLADGKGQCWRSVKQAIINDQCDIIIVGRGITRAKDVACEARNYAHEAWEALKIQSSSLSSS